MTTRRQFIQGVGMGVTGGLLTSRLPWVVGALLWPRRVDAATMLDPQNPGNFTREGQQAFITGSVLTLSDTSSSDFVALFANDADAGPGIEVDVITTFQVLQTAPNNADAGNRVVINDGVTRSAIAACVVQNGVRGMGLLSQGLPSDPASYPVFVPVDWGAPVIIRLRRSATGDAEIVEVNGVAPSPAAVLPAGMCPGTTRPVGSVEFGCGSVEAECTVQYHAFWSERVVSSPLSFADMAAAARMRLGPGANDDAFALGIRFTLGAGSDGIAPLTEAVTVGLGTLEFTIPAGAFRPGAYGTPVFLGTIDGMGIAAAIHRMSDGTYDFGVTGHRADLTGTANPVPVSLVIGNDEGDTNIRARISR